MDMDVEFCENNVSDCEEGEMEEDATEKIDNIMQEIFGPFGNEADRGNERSKDKKDKKDKLTENIMWRKRSSDTDEANQEEMNILSERRFVVGEREILDLLKRSTCNVCGDPIIPATITEAEEVIAAGIKYKFRCMSGHEGKWISTPFYGGRSAVAILLHLMVTLSGASWECFTTGAKFINLAVGSPRYFYNFQTQFRVAVQKCFMKHMEAVAEKLKDAPLSLAVEVKCDEIPGSFAPKSTAVFMDIKSKNIVHLETGNFRGSIGQSPKMERFLIENGLNHLLNVSPYEVVEIISDDKRNLISLMRQNPFKHLQHSLYICQKAKKLAFQLGEIAKKPKNHELLPWIRPIVNHFWYCCRTSKGNAEKLLEMWFGILHHVTNQHFWPGGRCHHAGDHMENCPTNGKWLSRDSSAFQELRRVLINREWCGSLSFYVNCQQTWAIDNFLNHTLLHYIPERVSFTYDAYTIRNMLAVMDHNNHLHGLPELKENYLPDVDSYFSKKQWIGFDPMRKDKEYAYIPELLITCMKETYGTSSANYPKMKQLVILSNLANP